MLLVDFHHRNGSESGLNRRSSDDIARIASACQRLEAAREVLKHASAGGDFNDLSELSGKHGDGFSCAVLRAAASHLRSVSAISRRDPFVALSAANQAIDHWSIAAASISSSRPRLNLLTAVACSLMLQKYHCDELIEALDLITTASQRSRLVVAFGFAELNRLEEAIAIAAPVILRWRANYMHGSSALRSIEVAVHGWLSRSGRYVEARGYAPDWDGVASREVCRQRRSLIHHEVVDMVPLLQFANEISVLPGEIETGNQPG